MFSLSLRFWQSSKSKRKHISDRELEAALKNGAASQQEAHCPSMNHPSIIHDALKRRHDIDMPSYDSALQTAREPDQGAICPTCGGSGGEWATYNGYNRGTIGSEYEKCGVCGGAGRVRP